MPRPVRSAVRYVTWVFFPRVMALHERHFGSGISDGIRGGAGVETRIGTNLIAKAEYRYSNYSDSSYGRHQGVVGLGFRL